MKALTLVPVITMAFMGIRDALTYDSLHEKVVALIKHCELMDLYDAIELMEDSGLLTVVRDERRDIVSVLFRRA